MLAAGALLIAVYFFAVYLKSLQAFQDALDPLNPSSYLPILTLAPGALLLWLVDQFAMRRGRQEQN